MAAACSHAATTWLCLKANGRRGGLVVLEFDDLDAARRWHGSDEYQRARQLRLDAADTHSIALASL